MRMGGWRLRIAERRGYSVSSEYPGQEMSKDMLVLCNEVGGERKERERVRGRERVGEGGKEGEGWVVLYRNEVVQRKREGCVEYGRERG